MQLRLNNVAAKRVCVCVHVCVCVYNLVQANQIGSQFGWSTVVAVAVAVATCKICNCYENVSSARVERFLRFFCCFSIVALPGDVYHRISLMAVVSWNFNGTSSAAS